MLDKWFIEDVETILKNNNRIVLIDENREAEFLLELLKNRDYEIIEVNDNHEELKAKYEIEKNFKDEKTIIYTTINLDKLTFIREYCETNGKLEFDYLYRYIKDKAESELKLHLNIPKEEMLVAGKLSIGQDSNYWRKLSASGSESLFADFEEEVLDFITDTETFNKKYDKSSKTVFLELLSSKLGFPKLNKPDATIVNEVVNKIFENLLANSPNDLLNNIYKKWTNSKAHFDSLLERAEKYKLPDGVSIWNVSPHHPFKQVDLEWLKAVIKHINDKEWLSSKEELIRKRISFSIVTDIESSYLKSLLTLISFDQSKFNKLYSLEDCINFYVSHFYKVDTAIRHLYAEFLNDKTIMQPLQDYYRTILNAFLHKWFEYFDNYNENQSGKLKELFESSKSDQVAVIVGDGLSFELTKEIEAHLNKDISCSTDYILADFPSETENNMSRLYIGKDSIEKNQKAREKFLKENLSADIHFEYINDINYNSKYDKLVVISKDIDSLGEKFQQHGLKYFDDVVAEFVEKIKMLSAIGYKEIYIVSDHGFVLTGLLEESDKIEVNNLEGDFDKKERYIRTKKQQKNLSNMLVQIERFYEDYTHIIFSKSINPFKTTGHYGYSHGGITPQELITPFFVIKKEKEDVFELKVWISNKEKLKDIVSDSFEIKISTEEEGDLMKARERKVSLIFMEGDDSFYQSDIFEAEIGTEIKREFSLDNRDSFDVILIDAISKETLDRAKVSKKQIRNINL